MKKLPKHLISNLTATQAVQVSFARIDGQWILTSSISEENYKDFIEYIKGIENCIKT